MGGATPIVGAGARLAAREGRAAIKQAPQILRDESGFARVPNVGTQSSKARANMAADPDVPATKIPKKVAGLPKYQMKPEGKLAKAFLPTVDILKRQGVTGAKLGKLVDQATENHELYQAELTSKIPGVLKGLSRKERANFGDVVEGKTKAVSEKQAAAVKEWRALAPTIRDRGVKAGLDIGDKGPNYFPHIVDFSKLGKANHFNRAVNHLVETKQAKTPEEAIQLLNHAQDVARSRPNGNLEAARLVDLPDYDRSSSALSHYISGASKRIAHVETFGDKDKIATKLLAKIAKEGGDSEAARNAFNIAVGAKRYDSNLISPKTSGRIRSFNTLTKLGTAAISNATQSVNTATVAGYHRVLKGAISGLKPESREFVKKTGVVADALLRDLSEQQGVRGWVGKLGAPGFATVEKANRSIAALTGRRWANQLAAKGDAKSLKILAEKLGVEGNIGKELTEKQQIQAARKLVEITQFKTGAKDLPGWVDSPEGKLVAQFRTFQYKQTSFLYKEVLKPLVKDKNIIPLTRFLAALPIGYAAYETKNFLRNRPDDESAGRKTFEAFQQLGGAGLPGSLTQSLMPRFGKYLPPGVYASQAAGALGGPTVSTLGRYADALGAAAGKGDFKPAGRVALGTIPFIGGTLSNTLLPYENVGNRMNPAKGQASTGTASAASSAPAGESGTGLLDDNTTQAYKDAKKKEAQAKKDGVAAGTRLGGSESLDAAQQRIDTAQKKFNTGLSKESRDALTRYAKLNEDGRKKMTPAQEYAVDKAKFENDYRNGDMDEMDLYKRQTKLGKQAVTSQFSREAQELYSMSKANREAFLELFPEYGKFMGEAAKMDSALAAKGWTKKAKLGTGGSTRASKAAAKLNVRLKTRKHKAPTFGTYKASKKVKVKLQ